MGCQNNSIIAADERTINRFGIYSVIYDLIADSFNKSFRDRRNVTYISHGQAVINQIPKKDMYRESVTITYFSGCEASH